MPAGAVIGREDELGELQAWLTACAAGPQALALAGEPGIGKTVLWEAAVTQARRRGYRVLVHRSVEAEASFAFAGLTDLVGPVFDEVADRLTAPRRRALQAALLLDDAHATPPSPHAIGLALLDVLRLLVRDGPVLVALDDLQWLDASSAAVLPAAVRRLDGEPVGLLATVRAGSSPPGAWEPTALRMRSLAPLDVAELHALLRDRLGTELARPALAHVHEASGGNPFFALELVRSPDGRVPESLRDVLGGRLAGLPAQTGDVLLLAAALARPSEDLICAAHGSPEAARAALEAADEVLAVDEGRLRFAHPLLASLCYERVTPSRRRDAHRRLAPVVADLEERARHLALATAGPDAGVATELEAASAHAAARGAAVAAAELAQLAADRTPVVEVVASRRRRLTARRQLWLAGDLERASAIDDRLLAATPSGVDRADLLHVLALSGGQRFATRAAMCAQGVAEAGEDDTRAVELLVQLGIYRWFAGDLASARAATREALQRAERHGDPRLLVIAQSGVAHAETWALDVTPGLLGRAVATEATLPTPLPFYMSPRHALAVRLVYCGDPEAGCTLLARLLDGDSGGAEHTRGFAYFFLPFTEWLLGRWDSAERYARDAREYAAQTHDPSYRGITDFLSALVEADRGHIEEARGHAESGLQTAASIGDAITTTAAEAQLGHIALLEGDHDTAFRRLRVLPDRMLRHGHHHPTAVLAWPDTIEALLAVGEVSAARRRLGQYADVATRARGSHRIAVERSRGLLAAALGELDDAVAALERAVASDDPPSYPLERARTLLALGSVRRQAQQRSLAREVLQRALAGFEALGAGPWAARARDELRRVSGRRPRCDDLTDAERRVATLATSGLRNKEIAARLVVEVGTVETHLSRVYRKLGVRSRTELAARLPRPGHATPT